MTIQDSIERSILISAPLEVVWALISTPGWWVNEDGQIIEHECTVEADLTTLHWKGIDLPIRTVDSDPPRSIRYLWGSGESDSPTTTTIDFTLAPQGDQVLVTVVESGLRAYTDPDQAARILRENSKGWESELAAAAELLGA